MLNSDFSLTINGSVPVIGRTVIVPAHKQYRILLLLLLLLLLLAF